jgi:hypothetical protein
MFCILMSCIKICLAVTIQSLPVSYRIEYNYHHFDYKTGSSQLGKPDNAPVVHFNGPLMIHSSLREGDGPIQVMAQIGVAGHGEGSFASITHSVAEQVAARPVTGIVFRGNDGTSKREHVQLNYDC